MDDITGYYKDLLNVINSIKTTDKTNKVLEFHYGLEEAIGIITAQVNLGKKIIFIGNGGSAAIASHMATDFWKNGGMKAVAFNDVSGLTCVANDFGYEHVFEKPIEMFAEPGDVLVAISSSGKSENILSGVHSARRKGCKIITLSGFDLNNPLRLLGDLNFYAPSKSYGHVEITHHSICHCFLDSIIQAKVACNKLARNNKERITK